jgi:hypothetical protein
MDGAENKLGVAMIGGNGGAPASERCATTEDYGGSRRARISAPHLFSRLRYECGQGTTRAPEDSGAERFGGICTDRTSEIRALVIDGDEWKSGRATRQGAGGEQGRGGDRATNEAATAVDAGEGECCAERHRDRPTTAWRSEFRKGEPCGEESIDADLGWWSERQLERNVGHAHKLYGEIRTLRHSAERLGTGGHDARNSEGCHLPSALGIGANCRNQFGGYATPGNGVAGVYWGGEAHHGAVKQGGLRRTIPEINGVAHRSMIRRAAWVRREAALR